MAEEAGSHFGADEEALERYALGRLDEAERTRMEQHASSCPSCRSALHRELLAAAGARKLGRSELKARLSRGHERDGAVYRRLLAAASVMLAAGLGVYYAFFAGRGGEQLTSYAPGAPPAVKNEFAQGAPSSSHATHIDREAATAPRAKIAESAPAAGAPSISGGKLPPVAAQSLLKESHAEGFWSDGIVEPEEREAAARMAAADEVSGAGALKDAAQRMPEEFVVRQSPAEMFGAQSAERKKSAQETVPTHFAAEGGKIVLTLSMIPPADDRALASAYVEHRGDSDTLVLHIAGKKVLYTLPRGWEGKAGAPR